MIAEQPVIQIDNITRRFGKTLAVDHLSFRVHAGEVFGFIGPNGAGKTTSMRILATLDMPTEGEAWIDGFSVIDDPDRVRNRLGFMPDGFGTYSDVNCEEYLDFFAGPMDFAVTPVWAHCGTSWVSRNLISWPTNPSTVSPRG